MTSREIKQEPDVEDSKVKLEAPTQPAQTEHAAEQESSSGSSGHRSIGVAPEPSVMSGSRAECLAHGSSEVKPQVLYLPPLTTKSSSEMSVDSKTSTPTQVPFRSQPDPHLCRQLNQQFKEQLLQEYTKDKEKVGPMLEKLFHLMEILHLRSPMEIVLIMIHNQPPSRMVLEEMLNDCPSGTDANLLLDQILMKLLALYTSSPALQPGIMPPVQQQQQGTGQQQAGEEERRQSLQTDLCISQKHQPLQGQQPGQREQEGQVLQPHEPTFQGQQQSMSNEQEQEPHSLASESYHLNQVELYCNHLKEVMEQLWQHQTAWLEEQKQMLKLPHHSELQPWQSSPLKRIKSWPTFTYQPPKQLLPSQSTLQQHQWISVSHSKSQQPDLSQQQQEEEQQQQEEEQQQQEEEQQQQEEEQQQQEEEQQQQEEKQEQSEGDGQQPQVPTPQNQQHVGTEGQSPQGQKAHHSPSEDTD